MSSLQIRRLRIEIEKLQWLHQQELAEMKHNLGESRAAGAPGWFETRPRCLQGYSRLFLAGVRESTVLRNLGVWVQITGRDLGHKFLYQLGGPFLVFLIQEEFVRN